MTVISLELTQGYYTDIDAEDWPLVSRYTWLALRRPKTVYAATTVRKESGRRTTLSMHNLILPDAPRVDHIDQNGLNNRRSNLRAATAQQNSQNKRVRSDSRSGLKGVERLPGGSWRASISVDKRRTHLGVFKTAEEAARAYDDAAVLHFGEFAATNARAQTLSATPSPSTYTQEREILRQERRSDPRHKRATQRANFDKWRARQMGVAFIERVELSVLGQRDQWVCGICHAPVDPTLRGTTDQAASIDHVTPLIRGGDHSYANTQISHLGCNRKKGIL